MAVGQVQHRLAGELDVGWAGFRRRLRLGAGALAFFLGHRQREAGPQTQRRHGGAP